MISASSKPNSFYIKVLFVLQTFNSLDYPKIETICSLNFQQLVRNVTIIKTKPHSIIYLFFPLGLVFLYYPFMSLDPSL